MESNLPLTKMNALKYAQSKMSDVGVIMTCRNCTFCDLEKSVCAKFNAQPPISVVTTGCDEWEIMIPF